MTIGARTWAATIFIAQLLGCAAAGVPYTNDPATKLSYAYQLMNLGRALPSERIGKEALADYESTKNLRGIADAHMFLGNFYKSKTYRSYEGFYAKYNEYDPTAKTSISHFNEAADIFRKLNDNWGVSTALFSMGNAEGTVDNRIRECELYTEALDLYLGTTNDPNRTVHKWNSNFESYDQMVRAFMERRCSHPK